MDAVFQKALDRREVLRRELHELEGFLKMYQRFLDETKTQRVEPDFVSPTTQLFPPTVKRKVRPADLVVIIERMLRASGQPMQRGEIVDALASGNIELESQDPARYVGTILWRNGDRFINVPGEGYTLSDLLTNIQKMKIVEAKASLQSLSEDEIEEVKAIAQLFLETVSDADRQRIRDTWLSGNGLPSDLDGKLLHTARETLNRNLEIAEKRELREQVWTALN